jgi:hypothetical protein
MTGKKEHNKTFRFDDEFSEFLRHATFDTGLSLADLIRISIPIAFPTVLKLCNIDQSLAETVSNAMLKNQQD